jgi:transposase
MARPLIPDDLWRSLEPNLPLSRPYPKGGRPVVHDRDVLTGIVFVLKTGINWGDLPEEMGCGCGMTCFRRLRKWHEIGVWQKIRRMLESQLPYAPRVDWERADVDVRRKRVSRGASAGSHPVFEGDN